MTLISTKELKTDKTEETYRVSNNEFLEAVFGYKVTDARPMLASFKGHPNKVTKSAWMGKAWNPAGHPLSPNANNYFSIAVFLPDEAGKYKRKKKQFKALPALMLDDIGTKGNIEALTLAPSWLLETSPSNYQAGYIFKEPLQDIDLADKLMKAIITAGLCDPGAGGPAARLARLPEAVNGKHSPEFRCLMKSWSPEQRYTIEELVEGLKLDLQSSPSPKASSRRKTKRSDKNDAIFIPCPTDNAVLSALRTGNLYKSPLGNGKHEITCPWVNEHTESVDSGSAYFEPDNSYPLGGFNCFHGHCAHRHIYDLLHFLDIEVSAARMKAVIRVIPGEIHTIRDTAELELSKSGKYYRRGGFIVTVNTDSCTKETSVYTLSQPALVTALAEAATWEKYDGRTQEFVRCDPPPRHCSVLFDDGFYKFLPVLNGLTRQPYLRSDGSLVKTAGYDVVTGMFGVFNADDFLIPDHPTKEEAEDALNLINGLLEEFAFANHADISAVLAAILTAVVRPSLPLAPMFHVKAPMISSGKSFLCKIISAFATPQQAAPSTFPQDDEECRKVLLAELIRSPAVIEFDNLTSDLIPHRSLCATLTEEFITGRILGASKTATVSTRVLFLSSGNNVGPVQDMARRCITIHLDPACEVPATRTFKNPHLLRNLHRERGRYVAAALTIIRAWIVAGRPYQECRVLASYMDWSDVCRQPLLWLNYPDPTASVFEAMNEDPDREKLGRLLSAWKENFGTKAVMVREAVNKTSCDGELEDILNEIAGERTGLNRRVLGRWIKRHANRIVNGLRFIRAAGSRSAEAWKVESVSSVLSVTNDAQQKNSIPPFYDDGSDLV